MNPLTMAVIIYSLSVILGIVIDKIIEKRIQKFNQHRWSVIALILMCIALFVVWAIAGFD